MKTIPPSGIESGADGGPGAGAPSLRAARTLTLDTYHWRLIQVLLMDQTDSHNELVQEREWLLHPSEGLELEGNLFALENPATGEGTVFIRRAALPHARPVRSEYDLRLTPVKGKGFTLELLVAAGATDPEPYAAVPYDGGPTGRIRALQVFQRKQRPVHSNHAVPLFMSNTWGDRSRDSRIEEGFLLREIEAAARLGVDVLQLDDGWQRGITANSARAKELGGVWEGFWAADPDFWSAHPVRLPRGLAPVAGAVRKAGLRLGLWFAPDSAREFANWRLDADRLGLLLWAEITVYWKPDFNASSVRDQARRSPAALIDRDLNRPSVVIWSVANETPPTGVPARDRLVRDLCRQAKRLDPSRLVSFATMGGEQPGDPWTYKLADKACTAADVVGWNQYLGWYQKRPDEVGRCTLVSPLNKPLLITETGGCAPWGRHGKRTERWTEEFMAAIYEGQIRLWERTAHCAGVSTWLLMDFKSPLRQNETQRGFNRKGVVDSRLRRKLAFGVLQQFFCRKAAEGAQQERGGRETQ
ncbi:MAG: glycoside hydrolase family 2 TIM barrel-domain containing protein [Planctomycetota bacterium]